MKKAVITKTTVTVYTGWLVKDKTGEFKPETKETAIKPEQQKESADGLISKGYLVNIVGDEYEMLVRDKQFSNLFSKWLASRKTVFVNNKPVTYARVENVKTNKTIELVEKQRTEERKLAEGYLLGIRKWFDAKGELVEEFSKERLNTLEHLYVEQGLEGLDAWLKGLCEKYSVSYSLNTTATKVVQKMNMGEYVSLEAGVDKGRRVKWSTDRDRVDFLEEESLLDYLQAFKYIFYLIDNGLAGEEEVPYGLGLKDIDSYTGEPLQ